MSSDIPYDKISAAPPAYDNSYSGHTAGVAQMSFMSQQPAYNPQYPDPSHLYPSIPGLPADVPYTPTSSGTPADNPVTQQPSNIVINMVGPGSTPFVGPRSMFMTCPNCQVQIKTRTRTEYKCCATLCCCLMMCTMICTLFSCVPYCMDSCKIVHHRCPNCEADLGVYNPA